MGSMIETAAFEVVEDVTAQFFAPAAHDLIDGLLGQYQQARRRIDQLAELIAGDLGNVVHYFIEGNAGDERFHRSVYIDKLFGTERAIKALDSAYWSKALGMTDVLDYMPQKRRDQWNTQLTAWKQGTTKPEEQLPEFTDEAVRSTIPSLLAMRSQFFGERVDGVFRALSHTHVTNCPQGFSKRMILSRVICEYGTINHSQAGCINDLRAVIAKFMGRDEPRWNATSSILSKARATTGEWITIDGGALRLRVYKVGTAHLEVHPDMAWRLNQVLASMHPAAIPSEFRTKPKKQPKSFQMIGRPLPFAVLDILFDAKVEADRRTVYLGYSNSSENKIARAEAERVLERIGGVKQDKGFGRFAFDYDPGAALGEITTTGCVPDIKAHQFYPTPERVAAAAIEAAEIGDTDTCLEPSAGLGGLADLMPKDRTTCVEISALHCAVLGAKGYKVHQADFLAWAPDRLVDRVVMNPPYSQGRWKEHLAAAAQLVNPNGGRLVAILPAGAKALDVLPGWTLHWSAPFENEFAGTSIAVSILTAVPN